MQLLFKCFLRTLPLGENRPPVADAGGDRVVLLPVSVVALDGSASSDDRGIASYLWERDSESLAAGVSVPEMAIGVSVCEMAAGVSVPEMAIGVSVCELAAGVSVPEIAAGVSVCEMAARVSVPEMAAGLSVCEMAAGVSMYKMATWVSVRWLQG